MIKVKEKDVIPFPCMDVGAFVRCGALRGEQVQRDGGHTVGGGAVRGGREGHEPERQHRLRLRQRQPRRCLLLRRRALLRLSPGLPPARQQRHPHDCDSFRRLRLRGRPPTSPPRQPRQRAGPASRQGPRPRQRRPRQSAPPPGRRLGQLLARR